jgi:transcriptional regulator with XRE-family HTH domain
LPLSQTKPGMSSDLQIFLKQLGENIARIRTDKGFSQTDLADELEMDRANLRRIEAGRSAPGTSTLFRISKVLKIEVRDFFEFPNPDEVTKK